MPVVNAARLRRFMSNPHWSPEQTETAELLCSEAESSLSAALFDAPITPIPVTETAPVLNTGVVGLTYPVAAVTSIDGTGFGQTTGYVIRAHRLRRDGYAASIQLGPAEAGFSASILTVPDSSYNLTLGAPRTNPYVGQVTVSYQAGWGAEPALVNAILRKAAAFMHNRHSDVVVSTGLDGQAPPPAPETWSAEEIAALSRFRRLDVGGTA